MKRLTARRSDKDELIGEIYDMWEESGLSTHAFAVHCDITTQTLYNWFYGDVTTPHLRSIRKVTRACGYELVTARTRDHNTRRSR